jgi:hypothetical protein
MMAEAKQQDKDPSSPTTTRTASMPEDREAIAMTEDAPSKTCQNSRSHTRQDLELFNVLEHPVYVFDIERKAMWWANRAAMTLWNAETLQSLLDRDFAHDMSEATSKRLTDCLRRCRSGEKFSEVVCLLSFWIFEIQKVHILAHFFSLHFIFFLTDSGLFIQTAAVPSLPI